MSQLGGNAVCRLLGLVRLAVFAPLLGPVSFGLFRLAFTALSIISALSGLGLHASYLRFVPEARGPGAARLLVARCLAISLVVSGVVTAGMLAFPGWVSLALFSDDHHRILAAAVAVGLPLTVLYKSLIGAAQGEGRFAHAASAEILQNVVFLVLGAAALVFLKGSPVAAFVGYLAGMALASRGLWHSVLRSPTAQGGGEAVHSQASTDIPRLVSRSIAYGAWFAVIPASQYFFDFIDRWALMRYVGAEAAGVYSIVPLLAGGILFLGPAITTVVSRRGAWLLARGEREAAHRGVWAGLFLSSFGSFAYAVVVLFAQPLIWRVSGPVWATAAVVLPISLTYYSLYNATYLLGTFAALEECPWMNLVAGGSGAVVAAVLNLVLVPRFGMPGAAWGTLGGLVVLAGCHAVFIVRRNPGFPVRAVGTLLVPFAALLPAPVAAAALLVAAGVAFRTNILCTDSERRIVTAWLLHVWRRRTLVAARRLFG